jgi:hypothetical protein
LSQSLKHDFEIASIEKGTQIDRSCEQRSNADLPSVEMLEPGANVTVERRQQQLKHRSGMI